MVLLPSPRDGWKELPEVWNTLLTEPVHRGWFTPADNPVQTVSFRARKGKLGNVSDL